MKKFICLLLSIALLSSILSGCKNKTEEYIESTAEPSEETTVVEPSVWDGSIATAFAGGDGSENDPYQISTSEELAFLAQQVNSGNSYTGMHIELTNDIDLNNLEWTPIGNGEFPFMGSFDGNEHTIKNLKISTITKYFYFDQATESTETAGVIGLFGLCENANFYDINISSSTLNICNPKEYNQLYVGILIGRITSNQNSNISNVRISKVTVLTDKTSKENVNGTHVLYVGGVVGYAFNDSNANLCLQSIQSEISINCKKSYSDVNNLGGCIGLVNNRGVLKCSNFSNNLILNVSEVCMSDFYCGSFGYIYNNNRATVSNIFSKVSANKKPCAMALGEFPNNWNAIAGNMSSSKITESTLSLQNLFGYVTATDDTYEPFENILKLYDLPEYCTVLENNCVPCEKLPENHGFDESIWNLDDLQSPKLR